MKLLLLTSELWQHILFKDKWMEISGSVCLAVESGDAIVSCIVLQHDVFQSTSESECDVTFESDLEGSDDNDTQSNGSMSDSDEEYMTENESEVSSDEENESNLSNEDETPLPPHTFTLMADPFAD